MSDIDVYRKEIEEIDEKMASLFERRMEVAGGIAKYKKANGLPIFDSSREKFLVEKNLKYIKNPVFEDYYKEYITDMMGISKKYQHTMVDDIKVAYAGIEGSFASIASEKIFPGAERVSYKNFKEAYEAVGNGECRVAVLPIENSYAGEVGQVTDLMFKGNLTVTGVFELSVHQCLLGVPGSTVDSIKKVYSHPQALDQCAEFIGKHDIEARAMDNTAVAAKKVADMNDVSVGAIASAENAELYGLTVIQESINESATNVTKFAVFAKHVPAVQDTSGYRTSILMFTVKNAAGTLADAISVIGKYGYSMHVIRSRPLKDINWQYYFYTEVEGKLANENGADMLEELESKCDQVKVVGTYKAGVKLK